MVITAGRIEELRAAARRLARMFDIVKRECVQGLRENRILDAFGKHNTAGPERTLPLVLT
ncbi:hypothetical protein [Methylobacterium sp. ID0610]|uniref:hypothetical protein n=1 Tax=Methylobacterium carpenticola TaxID=3344827 RepID=UPI0036BABED8